MSKTVNAPARANIAVWGMHRSGTSLLCTLLAHSGVWFGNQAELISPNEENPKGFWEHLAIRTINDELLHASLSDWDYVSNFDFASIPGDTISDLRLQAEELLNQFNYHALTGIKEPRICLLYKFWRPLLKGNAHIFVSRHPAEIAHSLNIRNGIPHQVGLALCEFYLVHALNDLQDEKCLLLDHSDLLHQPVQSLQRVNQYLQEEHGYAGLTIDPDKLSTLVDMRYYRAKREQNEHDTLPDALQQLWDTLQQPSLRTIQRKVSPQTTTILQNYDRLAGFKAHITSKRLTQANTALDSHLREITSLYQSNKAVIDELHTIRLDQKTRIAQLTTKIEELHTIRLKQKATIAQLTGGIKELNQLQEKAQLNLENMREIADQAIAMLVDIDRQLGDPDNRPSRLALSIVDWLTRFVIHKPAAPANDTIANLQHEISELRAIQSKLKSDAHGETL